MSDIADGLAVGSNSGSSWSFMSRATCLMRSTDFRSCTWLTTPSSSIAGSRGTPRSALVVKVGLAFLDQQVRFAAVGRRDQAGDAESMPAEATVASSTCRRRRQIARTSAAEVDIDIVLSPVPA